MIIGVTGLHGSGKSFLFKKLSDLMSVPYFYKRDALKSMANTQNWTKWYREKYKQLGVYQFTKLILEFIPTDSPIVLYDTVHNPNEWAAIKDIDPNAILVGVFSPLSIRRSRNDKQDTTLDKKRVRYWHEPNKNKIACLTSEIQWAFSGCEEEPFLTNSIESFKDYIEKQFN